MQTVYFIVACIILYWLSDRVLLLLEARRGEPFENRTLVFFGLLLGSALVTFNFLEKFLGGG